MKEHPQGWRYAALRHVGQITNGATPTSSEPTYWDGDLPWATPEDLGSLRGRDLASTARQITDAGYRACGTSFVPPGSIILSTRAPIGHLAIARTSMCFNQGCRAVTLRGGHVPEFFYFQLHAMRDLLASFGQGSTFQELSRDKLAAFRVLIPPTREQQAIADFLDRETARIDALVAKQNAFIRTLDEHASGLVNEVVCHGLHRDKPHRITGIGAFPEVPEHWAVKPLMWLTPDDRQIMYGIVLPGPDFPGGVPIVKAGNVKPGGLARDNLKRTSPEIEAGYARSRLRTGDLVYAIRGSIGAVEEVPDEVEGANLTQDVARVAPRAGVNGRWLLHTLRSEAIFGQLEAGALGAAVQGINIRDLKRARVPVPPAEEQAAIAAHLDARLARHDALRARATGMIERLREHRAALITAAVTGGIAAARPLADQGPATAAAA